MIDTRIASCSTVKFIAITSGVLDEYFWQAAGAYCSGRRRRAANFTLDGWAPTQLALIARAVRNMVAYRERPLARMRSSARVIITYQVANFDELDEAEKERLRDYFPSKSIPILSPAAAQTPPSLPPFISNLSLSLA